MAITATDILASANKHFDDAEQYDEAMELSALQLAMGDVTAKIAAANTWFAARQVQYDDYTAARFAERDAIQAQLDALAGAFEG